ncbi:helix-turn-helix transcriptional regulator [Actinophytocola sp.]|uniref:helix-turn-helix domain-containing protein n=1 Tax=Actinophytocola sp. TaxID=1872138 RepID=UPI002D7FC9F6|nr:helix-turn-helix transcriptional regulator [Actinophytocola sp.]HET9141487.1 helix-turn-helix transcriptional regulator [Actinophytocola sp.]
MTESPNPSVRSRQVANQLRALREDKGLTGAEVAKQLGMSASKISRIETGHRMLSVDVVAALLGLYRVPERQRDQILDQVRKSAERGWWESQGLGLPELWKALIDFESRATRIQNYEPLVIPGLLQTDEYTGAIIKGINKAMTESELTNLVASRMARQAVLRRRDLQFLAVIDEGALRRPIAESGVMRRQLRQLVDSAERPNITLRVVPLQAGPYVGLRGPFIVMDFGEEPSLVHLEHQSVGLFLDEKEDIAAYRVALSNILNVALEPAESIELISALAGDHE